MGNSVHRYNQGIKLDTEVGLGAQICGDKDRTAVAGNIIGTQDHRLLGRHNAADNRKSMVYLLRFVAGARVRSGRREQFNLDVFSFFKTGDTSDKTAQGKIGIISGRVQSDVNIP